MKSWKSTAATGTALPLRARNHCAYGRCDGGEGRRQSGRDRRWRAGRLDRRRLHPRRGAARRASGHGCCCSPADPRAAERANHGRARSGRDRDTHPSGCPSRGRAEIFIEPVLPKPPLVVIGGSQAARAIMELAVSLSVELVAIDGRGPGAALSDLPQKRGLDHGFIIIATQGSGDYAALTSALATDAPLYCFHREPSEGKGPAQPACGGRHLRGIAFPAARACGAQDRGKDTRRNRGRHPCGNHQ